MKIFFLCDFSFFLGLMDNSGDAADATTPDTAVVADLGYLHKKFKKVAATFMHPPHPPHPAAAIQHPAVPVQCPQLLPPPPLPITPPPPPVLPALPALPALPVLPVLTPAAKIHIHPVLKDDKNVDADGQPVRSKGKLHQIYVIYIWIKYLLFIL